MARHIFLSNSGLVASPGIIMKSPEATVLAWNANTAATGIEKHETLRWILFQEFLFRLGDWVSLWTMSTSLLDFLSVIVRKEVQIGLILNVILDLHSYAAHLMNYRLASCWWRRFGCEVPADANWSRFLLKNRLAHPENCSFLLSLQNKSGSKYPEKYVV